MKTKITTKSAIMRVETRNTWAAFAFTGMLLLPFGAGAASGEKTALPDSVVPLFGEAARTVHALQPQHLSSEIEFEMPLRMRNFAAFQARVAAGNTVSEEEMQRDFLPSEADYAAVTTWLKGKGFSVTQTDHRRLGVFAVGTVAQIQEHLGVEMTAVTVGGAEFVSAKTAPSLPKEIASAVIGVNGLQPHIQAAKHQSATRMNTTNSAPFCVNQILRAYNAQNLGATGNGQTIGILIDTAASDSDLNTFWHYNNVNRTGTVETVNVNDVTLPDPSGEETLDEEWSSSVAPGANIRVYAAGSLSLAAIDRVLQQIVNDVTGPNPAQPNLHQLSISLGLGEAYMGAAQVMTASQYYAMLANAGVSVFVSSGDGGSNPKSDGESGNSFSTVCNGASDPSVTGVGGTSLTLDPTTGAITVEKGWSGSGGGVSSVFVRPSWQHAAGLPNGVTRAVPDVSLVADPNTGVLMLIGGQWYQYGGTSLSAPVWAGFCTLLNEARAKQNLAPIGLLNPKIYPLQGTACFHDVLTCSNGSYSAGAGFDMVTGLGTPNVAALIQALTGSGATAPVSATPVVTILAPAIASVGATVTVTGSNFTGVTAACVNGVNTTFAVNSATQLTLTVPTGATNGPVSVTNNAGTGTSAGILTVSSAPVQTTLCSTKFETSEGYNTRCALSGQKGWNRTGSGNNGLVTGCFSGMGNQAYIGYAAPSHFTHEILYHPVSYTATAGDTVTFSVKMAIVDTTSHDCHKLRDIFEWAVYDATGRFLFSVAFDNSTGKISLRLEDGRCIANTSHCTVSNKLIQTLTVSMDFPNNCWTASLDGRILGTNQPITNSASTATLGAIGAVWVPKASHPGNNYMLFDNFSVIKTTETNTSWTATR